MNLEQARKLAEEVQERWHAKEYSPKGTVTVEIETILIAGAVPGLARTILELADEVERLETELDDCQKEIGAWKDQL